MVEQYKDFITVAWDPPVTDGGAPISGYVVEKKDASRTMWNRVGEVGASTFRYKATKLIEGNEYLFRVAAENAIGLGTFALIDEGAIAKLPFGVPAAPRKLSIEDLNKSKVVLGWDKPDFDGGSPVTGYYVERRQAYTSRWSRVNTQPVTSPMFTVKNLIEGDEYEFRVVAENEAGVSKPSETTSTFIAQDPYTKPGKPSQPEATIEADKVTLTWSAPRDDGRSPISNYLLEMKTTGDIRWKPVTEEEIKGKSYTVSGLQSDRDYEFRVSAVNKAGFGQPSQSSVPIRYGKNNRVTIQWPRTLNR